MYCHNLRIACVISLNRRKQACPHSDMTCFPTSLCWREVALWEEALRNRCEMTMMKGMLCTLQSGLISALICSFCTSFCSVNWLTEQNFPWCPWMLSGKQLSGRNSWNILFQGYESLCSIGSTAKAFSHPDHIALLWESGDDSCAIHSPA